MTTNVPPPNTKRTTKGEPPIRLASTPSEKPAKRTMASKNLTKPQPADTVGLNFKVPAEFKRDFKIEAAMHGLNQVKLLNEMFAVWKKHKG